ncbi:hypothetical protein [Bacillus paramycoides]|uniref:hypothetical protein n=1 Tax=Bacillus paramycoides TaxID=2026194 RepID=UPI002E1E2BF7|nr:hypothetical protein [Bacillus paramycoides]
MHIIFYLKKSWPEAKSTCSRRSRNIKKVWDRPPIIGEENLVWAPNAVIGQHSLDALEIVVKRLRDVEAEGGDLDDIVYTLKGLGGLASRR